MNKIFLAGNLTRNFEGKTTGNFSYARAGLAVKRPFSKNDEVDFFNLVAFGKTADICTKYLSKGRKVFVEGRIQFNEYTDNSGDKRIGHSVIIDSIEFGDNKPKDTANEYVDFYPQATSDTDDIDVPF